MEERRLRAADLFEQGWQVASKGGTITFSPPGLARAESETVEDIKDRVRQTLQTARLRQLSEPSVRKFLERVERRRVRSQDRPTSILDLIDDGAELTTALRRANELGETERELALAQLVEPISGTLGLTSTAPSPAGR